ncbi:unnamed protein product [Cladocopium goreaui]|uniref:Uncharacterized protein n=1 Tax=Cladocopium goreaui TaxID=2562237 RepID=A0A9P1GFF0_9DINO|nr:unnamed protein product [Cladocopium goreaui]
MRRVDGTAPLTLPTFVPGQPRFHTTRIIQSTDDLEGFDEIRPEDKDLLRRIIAGSEDLRSAQFGTGVSEPRNKRGAEDPAFVAAKRRREEEKKKNQIELKKGNRCWTFLHVRGVGRDGELKKEKSPKPELGLIVAEEEDGSFKIQFESKEEIYVDPLVFSIKWASV